MTETAGRPRTPREIAESFPPIPDDTADLVAALMSDPTDAVA